MNSNEMKKYCTMKKKFISWNIHESKRKCQQKNILYLLKMEKTRILELHNLWNAWWWRRATKQNRKNIIFIRNTERSKYMKILTMLRSLFTHLRDVRVFVVCGKVENENSNLSSTDHSKNENLFCFFLSRRRLNSRTFSLSNKIKKIRVESKCCLNSDVIH